MNRTPCKSEIVTEGTQVTVNAPPATHRRKHSPGVSHKRYSPAAKKHVVVGSFGHGICLFLLGSFRQAEAAADVGRAGNHGGHSIGHDTDRERVRDRVGKCSVNGI